MVGGARAPAAFHCSAKRRVTLNNRSDVRHRFYWWNNAGVQVWDDSRIQYPMRFTASHGFREVASLGRVKAAAPTSALSRIRPKGRCLIRPC